MTFEVTPEGATVVVKDSQNLEMTAETDGTYELEAGTYNYTVSAEGYVEKTETFVVETEAQTVAVDLEKDPSYVTTSDELAAALGNEALTEITISGTIGSEDKYTIYTLERDGVTIKGLDDAKVFGTFIVKGDNVTIDGLAIENKGDGSTGSTLYRGAIYVYADSVTITNNTITNGIGDNEGLANGIQIMRKSDTENTDVDDYVITGNTLTGYKQESRGSESAAIVVTEGFKSPTLGVYANPINVDHDKIVKGNTFSDNKINLTHQDWTKSGDDVVIFIHPESEIDLEP